MLCNRSYIRMLIMLSIGAIVSFPLAVQSQSCAPISLDILKSGVSPAELREQVIRLRNLIHSSLHKYFQNRDGDWWVLPFSGIRIRHQVLWDVITSPTTQAMLNRLTEQADLFVVIIMESEKQQDSQIALKPTDNSLLVTPNNPHYQDYQKLLPKSGHIQTGALYHFTRHPPKRDSYQVTPYSSPSEVFQTHQHVIVVRSSASREEIAHEFMHHLQNLIETYPHLHPEVAIDPFDFMGKYDAETEIETYLLMTWMGIDYLGFEVSNIVNNLGIALRYLQLSKEPTAKAAIADIERLFDRLFQEFPRVLWALGSENEKTWLTLLVTPGLPFTPHLLRNHLSGNTEQQMAVLSQLIPHRANPDVMMLIASYITPGHHISLRKKTIPLLGEWHARGSFEILKLAYNPNEEDRDLKMEFHRAFRKLYGRAAIADPDLASDIQAYCREIGAPVGSDVSPEHKAADLAGRVFDEETEEGKRLVLTEIETALPSLLKIGDELTEALQITSKNYPPLQEQIDRITAAATAEQLLGLTTPDLQWILLKKPPLNRNQTVRELFTETHVHTLRSDTLASCIRILRDTGTELDVPILLSILQRSQNPRLPAIVSEALTSIKDRIESTSPETAAEITTALTPPGLGQTIKGFFKRFF